MVKEDWKVLLVEDEYDSVQMISKILQHSGIHVQVAHDGVECLATLNEMIPTIIIMDLALPEMDGWETLAHIRKTPALATIPVMAITAYHSVSVEEDVRRAGFNGYMPKPLDTQALVRHLARLVET